MTDKLRFPTGLVIMNVISVNCIQRRAKQLKEAAFQLSALGNEQVCMKRYTVFIFFHPQKLQAS
jgi:hypothetical protein